MAFAVVIKKSQENISMTAKPINESTLLFVIKLLKADVLDGKTVTRAGISTMPAKAENSVRTIIIPILDRMYFKILLPP